jgi:ferritin
MNKRIEKALNQQIEIEAASSQFYLAMAIIAESNGFSGTAKFMYRHSDEERFHMLKLIKFVNERGGNVIVPVISQPKIKFKSLLDFFTIFLNHEIEVTTSVNNLIDICMQEKDFSTHNFIQWYVSEQMEEEALARTILDKLKLIGDDRVGIYVFDRDLNESTSKEAKESE